jgi:uncharacterized membrane protein YhaH (DUF805 family)
MELMLQPLRKYADFQGRARRSEYWLFVLLTLGFNVVSRGLLKLFEPFPIIEIVVALIAIVCALGLLTPALAVAFRRLHDTGRSAWWLLLWLVPILGWIVLLVFLVTPGTPGPNRFGRDPKAADSLGAEPVAS